MDIRQAYNDAAVKTGSLVASINYAVSKAVSEAIQGQEMPWQSFDAIHMPRNMQGKAIRNINFLLLSKERTAAPWGSKSEFSDASNEVIANEQPTQIVFAKLIAGTSDQYEPEFLEVFNQEQCYLGFHEEFQEDSMATYYAVQQLLHNAGLEVITNNRHERMFSGNVLLSSFIESDTSTHADTISALVEWAIYETKGTYKPVADAEDLRYTALKAITAAMLSAEYDLPPSRADVEAMAGYEDELIDEMKRNQNFILEVSKEATDVVAYISQFTPAISFNDEQDDSSVNTNQNTLKR